LIHDIDYMIAETPEEAIEADNRAIAMADNDLPGIATKIGLTMRKYLFRSKFFGGDKKIGLVLKQQVKSDPYWSDVFEEYKLKDYLNKW
jgi:hypothetical protein